MKYSIIDLFNKNIITVIKPRTINIIVLTKMDAAKVIATAELVKLFRLEMCIKCVNLNCRDELEASFVQCALLFPDISSPFKRYMRAFDIRDKAADDYLSYESSGMDKDVLAEFKTDYDTTMKDEKIDYLIEVKSVVVVLVDIIKVLSEKKKALKNKGYRMLKDEYVPVLNGFLPLLQQMNLVPVTLDHVEF